MENVQSVKQDNGTFILKTDGSLYGIHNDDFNDMGENTGIFIGEDEVVYLMDDVIDMDMHFRSYFVIKSDHSLWSWGDNRRGVLCDGSEENRNEPKRVLEDVLYVDVDGWRTFILKTDHSLWYCGDDSYGYKEESIEDDDTIYEGLAEPKKIMDDVKKMSAGGDAVYIIKQDNTMYGWGAGPFYSDIPVYITDEVVDVRAYVGSEGSNFIRSDGILCLSSKAGTYYYRENELYIKSFHEEETEFNDAIRNVEALCETGKGGAFLRADGTLWTFDLEDAQMFADEIRYYNDTDYMLGPSKIFDNILIP